MLKRPVWWGGTWQVHKLFFAGRVIKWGGRPKRSWEAGLCSPGKRIKVYESPIVLMGKTIPFRSTPLAPLAVHFGALFENSVVPFYLDSCDRSSREGNENCFSGSTDFCKNTLENLFPSLPSQKKPQRKVKKKFFSEVTVLVHQRKVLGMLCKDLNPMERKLADVVDVWNLLNAENKSA